MQNAPMFNFKCFEPLGIRIPCGGGNIGMNSIQIDMHWHKSNCVNRVAYKGKSYQHFRPQIGALCFVFNSFVLLSGNHF